MDTTFDVSPHPDPAVGAAPAGGIAVPRMPRWLPLAGVAAFVLSFVGDGLIGDFPEGDTSPAALARWYAAHHAGVAHGGFVTGIAAIFAALFAAALIIRCRTTPVAAAIIAVGGAAQLAHDEWSAAAYSLMGHLSTQHGVTPAALQAWHIAGSEFGMGAAMIVLLLGVAVAAVRGRAIPTWLGLSGLVLGLGQLAPNPWGFWALLLIMVWYAVAGITLTVRAVQ